MAFENPVLTISLPSSADLETHQHKFVVDNGSGQAAVAGAAAAALGVLQNDPGANGTAAIMVQGVSRVRAGAAIAVGSKVGSDANGKARVATSGDTILGIALEAAAADEDIIPVLLHAGTALLV